MASQAPTTDRLSSDNPSSDPIDPRIRARRIQVKRDQGRRRLHRLAIVGVVVAVAAGVFALTRSPLLSIRGVKVSGAHHNSAADIEHASRLTHGTPLIDVSVGTVARRVEALPWVAHATVSRDWPSTVSIHVTERRPAAALPAAGGGWLIVDVSGRVLDRTTTPQAGLLAVGTTPAAGMPGTTVAVDAALLRVASAVPARLRSEVIGVSQGRAGLELRLRCGGVVELGSATDLTDKLVSTGALLAQPSGPGAAVIDVQVPAVPTLTPGPGCA